MRPLPVKFVLKKVKTGYHFVLKAKSAAKNGIASVKENAATATTDDQTGE